MYTAIPVTIVRFVQKQDGHVEDPQDDREYALGYTIIRGFTKQIIGPK